MVFARRVFVFLVFAGFTWGADRVIVIDAGHGGASPSGSQAARTLSSPNNAVSAMGLKEKDLTLELAGKVIAMINASPAAKKAGLRAVPTRTADVNPDFGQRAEVAAKSNAGWFLSIHFNAVPKGSKKASGTLGIVQMKSKNAHFKEDTAFASALTAAVNKVIRKWAPGSKALSVGDDHELHGGEGSNLFYQLRTQMKTPVTACFLEVEFMDNPAVEQALLGKNRSEVFDAIAAAISATVIGAAAK
ncbi:MAG TPA: N-acetylmuramoyl-L-alanine amidase [Verrucomicrobiales bacterium]|nr:N-acetylmuramoyl-L-alanine amidase [Verrucomicrobiales bacterium]